MDDNPEYCNIVWSGKIRLYVTINFCAYFIMTFSVKSIYKIDTLNWKHQTNTTVRFGWISQNVLCSHLVPCFQHDFKTPWNCYKQSFCISAQFWHLWWHLQKSVMLGIYRTDFPFIKKHTKAKPSSHNIASFCLLVCEVKQSLL